LYEPKTIVPADDGEAADRRESLRHVAVMRVAKLHTAHGEELCLVRNISEGGLKARVWSDLGVGDTLTAEFKSGNHVPGTVVWQRADHIGMQFNEVGDVTAILGGDEDPAPGFHPRAPRVHLEMPARVRIGARYYRVMLHDISQGGAKVRLAPPDRWQEGEPPAVLTLTGLPPIDGILRWHNPEVAGIAFNTPIPLDTLARWVASRHS
jgi:hypothetical protein